MLSIEMARHGQSATYLLTNSRKNFKRHERILKCDQRIALVEAGLDKSGSRILDQLFQFPCLRFSMAILMPEFQGARTNGTKDTNGLAENLRERSR